MRTSFLATIAAGALICGATAALAEPVSGTIIFRATATFSDGSTTDRLYKVALDADSDGDGHGDEAWLRVACSGGAMTAAYVHTVKSPRDAATGQASGKRMHKPFNITKEFDRSSAGGGAKVHWDPPRKGAGKIEKDQDVPQSARGGKWDVKNATGGRAAADGKTMAVDDWHAKRTTMRADDWNAVVVNPGVAEVCDD